MKRVFVAMLVMMCAAAAGCSGISSVRYNRFDRGRPARRLAVIAHNQSVSDRYQMWAWTKKKPRVVPPDIFDEQVVASLAPQTDYQIVSPQEVKAALEKLDLQGKLFLSRNELEAFRRVTGADEILFADVTFYLQNYLFWKFFGVVEITMRLVGVPDGRQLWEAKGRNVGLFITTDSALVKVRDKMIAQLARKLENDKAMRQ